MRFINCTHYKQMLLSAANNLDNKHLEIDGLNVFPVPDGDTGTNMNMTFFDAVMELQNYTNDNIGDCSKFLAKKMLMGARGNSGVILSQIFKGMSKSFEGLNKITIHDFSKALIMGYSSAYKAVMRPAEGTILTVIREPADYAEYYCENHRNTDFIAFFDFFTQEMKNSLERTPELLPVLKEAGVVDSGGAGLYAIIEGINLYLKGIPVHSQRKAELNGSDDVYCVETCIDLNDKYKKEFDTDGVGFLLGANCSDIKMRRINNSVMFHVHTRKPSEALNVFTRLGVMKDTSILSAKDHKERFDYGAKNDRHEKYALIAVCSSKGIEEAFGKLGVSHFVSGGQTMNPSTEDFLNVINEINADHILIFPNNPNIILAANQAKEIASDKNVIVIAAKTICEGMNGCIAFDGEKDIEQNLNAVNTAIRNVVSLAVTHSIKSAIIGGKTVEKGQYIGISGKNIISCGNDMMQVTQDMFSQLGMDEYSFATIIYGAQNTQKNAEELLKHLEEKYDFEGQIICGQQDLYPFIIGIE